MVFDRPYPVLGANDEIRAAAECESSPRHEASRGKRYSKYINRKQARNLLDALAFADEIGLRLNVAVDISWLMFSGTVDDRTRFSRCQQRLSKWAKREGFGLTLIWTREVGKHGSSHTHVLIHVPPWLMETKKFPLAIERALEAEGGPNHEKATSPWKRWPFCKKRWGISITRQGC
jgi:hypothetical protein